MRQIEPPQSISDLYASFSLACSFAVSVEELRGVGREYRALIARHQRREVCMQIYNDRFAEIAHNEKQAA